MEAWSSLVAAVLSGVLLAAVIFYVWGRRVERRAADTSQRLVFAAKEELMSVRENLHKSLDQKLAGVLQSDGLLMSSLAYEVSPETLRGAEEDLTAEGLAALDRRASSIAGLMHLVLLRYRDLRVGNAETGGRPGPRFAAMAAIAAPVAEPGEATIRVTIEAELLLAAPHP